MKPDAAKRTDLKGKPMGKERGKGSQKRKIKRQEYEPEAGDETA